MQPHERRDKGRDQCKEVFSLLSEYLNLELPPDACQEMEAHIAGCPPCVEFTESLRKTVELCRQYEPAELPAPLGQHAREELRHAYQKMLDARKDSEPIA
jgi:anti-sigma factor RsiW